MEQDNLPIGTAQEPVEEAHHPPLKDAMSSMVQRRKQNKSLTFAEASKSNERSNTHNSNVYKDTLSQPDGKLTQRQRLQWLQKRRTPGLWVQCDECNRWRFLPRVLDNHELPDKWYCRMNPDITVANCSVPESPIRVRDEEDLIHGEYTAGSMVWARLSGWPWWPAMVDDDPDTEQYYWLDGFSDIPTHYNVVFFDAANVTRAWISPEQMKPYSINKNIFKDVLKNDKYEKRIQVAIIQANDAEKLPLHSRLAKYSFIARYPGSINKPKNITKHDVIMYQNKIKRKYNFGNTRHAESADESHEAHETEENGKYYGFPVKQNNVIILGTPSRPKKSHIAKKYRSADSLKTAQESTASEINSLLSHEEDKGHRIQFTMNKNAKETDSITLEVGSTVASLATMETPDNGNLKLISNTYIPENVDEIKSILLHTMPQVVQIRIASPSSDDFEF